MHGALKTEYYRIYVGSTGRPSAAVIWAYLSEEMANDYEKKGLLANIADWNCGNQLWFLHVIAEGGKVSDIIKDCVNDPLFAKYDCGYMLRSSRSGKRRVIKVTRNGIRLVRSLPN